MDTDKTILMSSVVTLGSTLAHSMLPESMGGEGKLPSARLLIGSSLAFMGLSILGNVAPKVATGLAVTMGVSALTFYGIPIADVWFNDAKPPHRNSPTTPGTPGYSVTVTPAQRADPSATGEPNEHVPGYHGRI